MKNTYVIGVDIGGTNTDAVLVNQHDAIHAAVKVTTTESIETGFTQAVQKLLLQASIEPTTMTGVFVGTTHGTNAILQQKDLFKVGVIRLTGDCGAVLPSCSGWPTQLRDALYVGTQQVSGGFECDGKAFASIHAAQVQTAAARLLDAGAESLAIIGTFSPLNHEQEQEAAALISAISTVPISLSHQLGGLGFVERENSTILNAALKKSMQRGFAALKQELSSIGLTCPLYITQNNGTIFSLEEALAFPVLTISAGPTNSFVGSTKLAQVSDAIVADIGGTSTDVGIVHNGFARRSLHMSCIGGVKLNFSMPDVLSVGLGGGSHVTRHESGITIGPMSCGRLLQQQSYAFGGNTLTLTDAALYRRNMHISGADVSRIPLTTAEAQACIDTAETIISTLAQKMAGPHDHLPLLLTGGGSALFKKTLLAERAIIPEHADVANAYGAALAEISGTVDTIVSLEQRKHVLEQLIEQACNTAHNRGAKKESLRIVEQEIIPYNYIPGKLARVKITVAGRRSETRYSSAATNSDELNA